MAAGLIKEECEDVSVVSALDDKDYGSFTAKKQTNKKKKKTARQYLRKRRLQTRIAELFESW